MHEPAERLVGSLVTADQELEREFEARLADSSRLAFRVAFSVLRLREDAEDVAQDAFAKAYRRFNQLRDRTRFRAWLVRITWRLSLDRQRANRRRSGREVPVAVPVEAALQGRLNTAEVVAARERAEHLWNAIEALPEKLRLVVVLAGIEGHDMHEVSALQDKATPTVGEMPVFRTFRSTNTLVLRDGQMREFTAAADRVNGEVIRIAVTLRVAK